MPTIVLASADSTLYDTLQAEVSGMGHELFWATTGLEAIELVLQHRPLLVLLDSPLEVYTTFETSRQLRSDPDIPDHLPVIYMHDDPEPSIYLSAEGITETFPRTHTLRGLEELVAKYQRELQNLEDV